MTDYDDAPTNVKGTPQGAPDPPGRPLSQEQKAAVAAALVGTAALGGAAYGMSYYLDEPDIAVSPPDSGMPLESDPTPDTNLAPTAIAQSIPEQNGSLIPPVIPLVSELDRNDMTFENAFQQARGEMGAGHYFEWHGQLYNTYFKEEWEGMSPGDHKEFLASVNGNDAPGITDGALLAGGEIPSHTVVPAPIEDTVPDDSVVPSEDLPTGNFIAVRDDTEETPEVTVDDSLHVPGDTTPSPEQDTDVAIVEMDGQDIIVFDFDHDDQPDAIMGQESQIALFDTDQDHFLDTKARFDADSQSFVDIQEIDQPINFEGSMEALHNSTVDTGPAMTDDSDFGADFDNNADIIDYDV